LWPDENVYEITYEHTAQFGETTPNCAVFFAFLENAANPAAIFAGILFFLPICTI